MTSEQDQTGQQSGQASEQASAPQSPATQPDAPRNEAPQTEAEAPAPAKRSRSGSRRRGRSRGKAAQASAAAPSTQPESQVGFQDEFMSAFQQDPTDEFLAAQSAPLAAPAPAAESAAEPAPKPRSRRRGKSGQGKQAATSAKQAAPAKQPEPEPEPEESAEKKKRQKMFISVLPGEQVEVVVAEEGKVVEYYVEMLHQARTKGNIYKGLIHNVDPNLQAAFISYGAERNGFLQIDEIHPDYYQYQPGYALKKGQRYPLIQKVLKPGQEVLVQVVKEPTGKKGAFLSTYLSLPGRHFVFSVGNPQSGVSRKIEDEKERERLKEIIQDLPLPEGVGLIARTAGIGRSKTELQRDYKYLNRLWTDIRKKAMEVAAPCMVYKEMDLAARAVRDYLTSDVQEVWVDEAETAENIKEYATLAFPRSSTMVKLHSDAERSLWERFNLTRQIEQIYAREVILPSGGRIVIDPTEALTAVDINSGKIGGAGTFQKMALTTNLEAAEAIAQQLRLRDIGGQIVVDFIEMKDPKHCREVEKVMKNALRSDRARTDVGRISAFGLMEIVRQRLGSSAIAVSTEPCPCCEGTGLRRNMEWQSLLALKDIFRLLRRPNCPNPMIYACEKELALYLLNHKREKLAEMGKRFENTVHVEIL